MDNTHKENLEQLQERDPDFGWWWLLCGRLAMQPIIKNPEQVLAEANDQAIKKMPLEMRHLLDEQ